MEEQKCSHLKIEDKKMFPLQEGDAFRKIYQAQTDLQERLGRLVVIRESNMQEKCKLIMEDLFHLNAEMAEMLERLPSKHWKKYDYEKMVDWVSGDQRNETLFEYIDAFHFFLNIGLALGFSAEEVYYNYLAKNKENHARQ